MNQPSNYMTPVANLGVEDRSKFIWRCYAHVAGGILAFAAIEMYLFQNGIAMNLARAMGGNWILVLGAFMLVSWGASHLAHRVESLPMQYGAYAALIVVWAVIFAPLLVYAEYIDPSWSIVESAAGVTIMGSIGLMAVAMITGKDFSFLRGFLVWGGILAMIAIVSAILFGLSLGTWFMLAMIGFAGASILYDTSNIMHHYPQDRYVAASMGLFSSIALMFWYVLQFFLASRD